MLSYIDPLLFPDHCEIFEVAPDRHVYAIFKNGSSTLRDSGFRKISPEEIQQLETVEVYVREPLERYVSGVRSYLEDLDFGLDRSTVLNMIDQYLFLNRHFCLQFHWLVNLARHTKASMQIKSLDTMQQITPLRRNSYAQDSELIQRFQSNAKLQFYLELDKVLVKNFVGQTVTIKDIVSHVRQHRPDVYEEIILRSQNICNVLD